MGIRVKFISLLISIIVVVFAGVFALIMFNLNHAVEFNLRTRLDLGARLIQRLQFRLNHESLSSMATIVEAELVVVEAARVGDSLWVTEEYTVIKTSLSGDTQKVVEGVLRADATARLLGTDLNRKNFSHVGFYSMVTATDTVDHRVIYMLFDKDEIDSLYKEATIQVLVLGLCVLIVLMLLSIFLARAITQPLMILESQAVRLSQGDWDVYVDMDREDEIGSLAKAFNKMTESLKVAQTKMIHAEKMAVLGQLSTGVAHEIKNPLMSLKLTTQLLQEQTEDAKIQQGLQIILSDVGRLQTYMDELLAYSKPKELHLRQANINDLVSKQADFMARQLGHLVVEMQLELDESIPEFEFDPSKIKQVIVNLMLNAAQASSPYNKIIVRTALGRGCVRLSVIDEGAGVDPGVQARIFVPFFSTKAGGTGLGLAVSKDIIEDHGGRIGFEPQTKGSLFWFELPIP